MRRSSRCAIGALAMLAVFSPVLSKSQDINVCTSQSWNLEACAALANESGELGSDAKVRLGLVYLYGLHDIPRNVELATNLFSQAAEENSAQAQNILGNLYVLGLSGGRRYPEAVSLFERAASQNYAPAQNNLGIMYFNGLGVDPSYENAMEQFSLAADQSYPPASNNLGIMYLNGLGIEEQHDYELAAQQFQQAINFNYAPAQNNLGVMYWEGWGLRRDLNRASDLFLEAARQRYVPSYFNLGLLHDLGEGIMQDDSMAAFWYKQAAENGDGNAQFNLALKYAKGEGVVQDFSESYYWFARAVRENVDGAADGLQAVDELLSQEQRELTQQRLQLSGQSPPNELGQQIALYNVGEALPELGGLYSLGTAFGLTAEVAHDAAQTLDNGLWSEQLNRYRVDF